MLLFADINMDEVTRLTRAGQLIDATSLLQSRLGRKISTTPTNQPDTHSTKFGGAGDSQWRSLARRLQHARLTPLPDPTCRPIDIDIDTIERPRRAELAGSSLPAGRFTVQTVTNAAGVLNYKLYVPSRCPDSPVPLVVMLHGCTQNPDDFAIGTRMNELAEIHGFLVAYPAQTTTANVSKCWNWFKDSEQLRDRGEPSLIADATRQILEKHQVDPRRVFVAGLSAGGAAAAIMGCTYPDIYAGVGVHSGLACGAASDFPSAFQAMRGVGGRPGKRPSSRVPTIVFHGTADRTVGPSNAEDVMSQVVAGSAPVTVERGTSAAGITFVRTVRRDQDGRVVGEQWMIDGGGHAWFGGNPLGSYTDSRGPDASREMLRFFKIISNGS